MKVISVLSDDIMPVIQDLLNNGQEVLLTVSGTSMRPFYHNQKTIVKLINISNKIKKFDVVLYRDKNKYKLHRIIKIKDDCCIICGDGLTRIESIKHDQIFGKVIEHHYENKVINENQKRYRLKVWIWASLKPFRRILLKLFGG